MEKSKNSLLRILIGIILIIGIIIIMIGIKCGEHARSVTPVFNGSGFEYGTEKYDLPLYIALAAEVTTGIAAIAAIALCKGCKLSGKIVKIALFVVFLAVHIFASLCISTLFASTGHERWISSYHPEYYVVSDRDNTVKLLFEEGCFLFDGHTNVYYLDNDMRAYEIGSFSTDDGAVMNGHYDIVRTGNKISFDYDFGTPIITGYQRSETPILRCLK